MFIVTQKQNKSGEEDTFIKKNLLTVGDIRLRKDKTH